MTLNPFGLIAKAFYAPFKGAILAAWNAAKTDAMTEIHASLPTDADFAAVGATLAQLRDGPEAIEDDEPAKRRNKKYRK